MVSEVFVGTEWMRDAVCRASDEELTTWGRQPDSDPFFDGSWSGADYEEQRGADQELLEPTRELCSRCPVTDACLKYALENDIRFGIWGGTTPRDRYTLRRRMGFVR